MRDIRNTQISPRDRAVCANALDRILERKRILRMKPAPKAMDADKYKEQKKSQRKGHDTGIIECESPAYVEADSVTETPGS